MSIIIKGKKTGQQVPPGTHIAVCYGVVDIGTQPDNGFGEKDQVILLWELPHERILIDGKEWPMGMSKRYTKSTHKKATLRKHLAGWRGKDFTEEEMEAFEISKIIGKACQLSVVATEDDKSVVDAVVALPKGTKVSPAMNPLVEYSVQEGKTKMYEKLAPWIRDCCDKCAEWDPKRKAQLEALQAKKEEPIVDDTDDDIPF